MRFSIAQKQNYLYVCMIIATVLIAIFSYQIFQQKWVKFRKAEQAFSKEKFQEAIELYQQSLKHGSIPPQGSVHLADSYVATGNFSEAIKWYHYYMELYPKDIQVRFSYANALNWSGNLEQAGQEYQKVLEQHELDKNH